MLKIIDQNYTKRITPVSTGRYKCLKDKIPPKKFLIYSFFFTPASASFSITQTRRFVANVKRESVFDNTLCPP